MLPITRFAECAFALGGLLPWAAAAPQVQAPPQSPAVSGSVELKLTEPVDSSRDVNGKQFHATVAQPVTAGSVSIPQNAIATLTLTKLRGGSWTVELNSILVAGQPLMVSGGPPTLEAAPATPSAPGRAGSALGRLGGLARTVSRPAHGPSASAAGARVVLPQGASLRFAFTTVPRPAVGAATAAKPEIDVSGVYKGSISCNAWKGGLKLSLVGATDGSVTGFLIFDLPPWLGSQGIYKVAGRYRPGRNSPADGFDLTTVPIGTPAPDYFAVTRVRGGYTTFPHFYGFTNFSCILSADPATAESPEAVAETALRGPTPWTAPPPVTPADTAAYRKSVAPAAAASVGLVRKSQAYWSGYRTDIIRQVFDGGFGVDVDDDVEFKLLFTSYVEAYSKSCSAGLPANHEAMAVTRVTTRTDRNGNVVSEQEGASYTVQVDSRFAARYRAYAQSLTSSDQGLANAIGIMSGRATMSSYMDAGLDSFRLVVSEGCTSATTRQFGENLLRASLGQRSLQETGGAIDGAAAESDSDVPAGRYARLKDACNAELRDHAAYCSCIGGGMSAEDEQFYAGDFRNRFLHQIAEPMPGKDPDWPRLHKAAAKCVGVQ
jgi:hypothetical protein